MPSKRKHTYQKTVGGLKDEDGKSIGDHYCEISNETGEVTSTDQEHCRAGWEKTQAKDS
jgi:hypothetical protein